MALGWHFTTDPDGGTANGSGTDALPLRRRPLNRRGNGVIPSSPECGRGVLPSDGALAQRAVLLPFLM